MEGISLTARISVRPNVHIQTVQDEAVILEAGQGQYFGLDAVGTRMWQVLVEAESIQAALPVLLEEYEVDEARLTADIQGLVAKLEARGLIKVEEEQVD